MMPKITGPNEGGPRSVPIQTPPRRSVLSMFSHGIVMLFAINALPCSIGGDAGDLGISARVLRGVTVTQRLGSPSVIPPGDRISSTVADQARAPQVLTAPQLLARLGETRAKLRSYRYVLEASTDLQARATQGPYRKMNGKSRRLERMEFRTDGRRYSVRERTWGNVKSTSDFLPENRCPYNSLLWDGKVFFEVVATTDKPGRVLIDTRGNVTRYRELVLQKQNPLWHWLGHRMEQQLWAATSLLLRPAEVQVGSSRCRVIQARLPEVECTLWIDPERGCNIVKATLVDRQHPDSWSLEGVVCQELQGTWIPMEGVVKRSRSYAHGDYERSVKHLKVTELVLDPDHHALRSFVPNDIKNGTWVEINPAVGQRFNPRELPLWQNGKVIDPRGRKLMEFPL